MMILNIQFALPTYKPNPRLSGGHPLATTFEVTEYSLRQYQIRFQTVEGHSKTYDLRKGDCVFVQSERGIQIEQYQVP